MKVVWKYPLTPGLNTVPMPEGAQPLTVGGQDGQVMLWALVDTDKVDQAAVPQAFEVLMTGERTARPLGRYLGAAHIREAAIPGILPNGIVAHVFEGG